MNINIRIDLTPGSARRIAYVGLTLLLVGLATVANAVPVKFMSHQKLTAEQLNGNFADLEGRVTALGTALDAKADKARLPAMTEWTPYTPTLLTNKRAAVAGQTTTGYYRRVGDAIEVRTSTAFTSAPASGAVTWQVTLPTGLAIDLSRGGPAGSVTVGGGVAQLGTLNVILAAYVQSSVGVTALANGDNSYYVNDQVPFAFANGATFSLYFTVPIAGWGATL